MLPLFYSVRSDQLRIRTAYCTAEQDTQLADGPSDFVMLGNLEKKREKKKKKKKERRKRIKKN